MAKKKDEWMAERMARSTSEEAESVEKNDW